MQEGAKRGGIRVLKQGQQQPLPKLQRQRELAAQLPHAVQEEEKGVPTGLHQAHEALL
ncbi:myotubularin-related protein 9-like isoform X2 [Prionailurus iriomotensis]